MQRLVLLAGAAALALSGAVAFAQGEQKGATATPSAPRTTASLECSKQADAKGLHGKMRRDFRAKCKRDFKSFGYKPKS
jgi:type IV secretory pathway VirD2 relaxase